MCSDSSKRKEEKKYRDTIWINIKVFPNMMENIDVQISTAHCTQLGYIQRHITITLLKAKILKYFESCKGKPIFK